MQAKLSMKCLIRSDLDFQLRYDYFVNLAAEVTALQLGIMLADCAIFKIRVQKHVSCGYRAERSLGL